MTIRGEVMNITKNNPIPDIKRTIIIDAHIEKVWNAISTSDGLAVWLMPNNFKLEMDYEFTFRSAPKNGWNGITNCKVTEINPPYRLAFTWCGNNMEQYVSFDLVKLEENRTEFTLIHAGWTEKNQIIRDIMYDGWNHIIENLSEKMVRCNGEYLS